MQVINQLKKIVMAIRMFLKITFMSFGYIYFEALTQFVFKHYAF